MVWSYEIQQTTRNLHTFFFLILPIRNKLWEEGFWPVGVILVFLSLDSLGPPVGRYLCWTHKPAWCWLLRTWTDANLGPSFSHLMRWSWDFIMMLLKILQTLTLRNAAHLCTQSRKLWTFTFPQSFPTDGFWKLVLEGKQNMFMYLWNAAVWHFSLLLWLFWLHVALWDTVYEVYLSVLYLKTFPHILQTALT